MGVGDKIIITEDNWEDFKQYVPENMHEVFLEAVRANKVWMEEQEEEYVLHAVLSAGPRKTHGRIRWDS